MICCSVFVIFFMSVVAGCGGQSIVPNITNENANDKMCNDLNACYRLVTQTKICSLSIPVMQMKCENFCEKCGSVNGTNGISATIPQDDIFKDNMELIDKKMKEAFTEAGEEYHKQMLHALLNMAMINIAYETFFPLYDNNINNGQFSQIDLITKKGIELLKVAKKNDYSFYTKGSGSTMMESLNEVDEENNKKFNNFRDKRLNDLAASKLKHGLIDISGSILDAGSAASMAFGGGAAFGLPSAAMKLFSGIYKKIDIPETRMGINVEFLLMKIDHFKAIFMKGMENLDSELENIRLDIGALAAGQEILRKDVEEGTNLIIRLMGEHQIIFLSRISDVIGEINFGQLENKKDDYMSQIHKRVIYQTNALSAWLLSDRDASSTANVLKACELEGKPENVLNLFDSKVQLDYFGSIFKMSKGNFAAIRPMIRLMMSDITFINTMGSLCYTLSNASISHACNSQHKATEHATNLYNKLNSHLYDYYSKSEKYIAERIEAVASKILTEGTKKSEIAFVILSQLKKEYPELKFLVYVNAIKDEEINQSSFKSYIPHETRGSYKILVTKLSYRAEVHWYNFQDQPSGFLWDRCHDGNITSDGMWYTKPSCQYKGYKTLHHKKDCDSPFCEIQMVEAVPSCNDNKTKARIPCFRIADADAACDEKGIPCLHNSYACRRTRFNSGKLNYYNTSISGKSCIETSGKNSLLVGGYPGPVCLTGEHNEGGKTSRIYEAVDLDCDNVFSFPEPINYLQQLLKDSKSGDKLVSQQWHSFDPEAIAVEVMKKHEFITLGYCLSGIITQSAISSKEGLNFATDMNGVAYTLPYKDKNEILNLGKKITDSEHKKNDIEGKFNKFAQQVSEYIERKSKSTAENSKSKKDLTKKLNVTEAKIKKNTTFLKKYISEMQKQKKSIVEADGISLDGSSIYKEDSQYIQLIIIIKKCDYEKFKILKIPEISSVKNCTEQFTKINSLKSNAQTEIARFKKKVDNKKKKKLILLVFGVSFACVVVVGIAIVGAVVIKKRSRRLSKQSDGHKGARLLKQKSLLHPKIVDSKTNKLRRLSLPSSQKKSSKSTVTSQKKSYKNLKTTSKTASLGKKSLPSIYKLKTSKSAMGNQKKMSSTASKPKLELGRVPSKKQSKTQSFNKSKQQLKIENMPLKKCKPNKSNSKIFSTSKNRMKMFSKGHKGNKSDNRVQGSKKKASGTKVNRK